MYCYKFKNSKIATNTINSKNNGTPAPLKANSSFLEQKLNCDSIIGNPQQGQYSILSMSSISFE